MKNVKPRLFMTLVHLGFTAKMLTLNALYLLAFSGQYQLAFCGPGRSDLFLREDATRGVRTLISKHFSSPKLIFRFSNTGGGCM
jgi:hypothetical protein